MKRQIKAMIRSLARKMGYKIVSAKDKATQLSPFVAQYNLLSHLAPEAITIFDAGAYIGDVTASYLKNFPQAKIYSFEPSPESFAKVKARFEVVANVIPINAAISQQEGEASFFLNQLPVANSLLERPKEGKKYYPARAEAIETIQVRTISFDSFAAENNLKKINILKMDIQGGELNALKGAVKLLSEGAIDLIFSEVLFVSLYQDCPLMHDIASFLENYDYSLYDIYELMRRGDGQLRYANALFISPGIREKL
jgi:FkbM family methyltransferase